MSAVRMVLAARQAQGHAVLLASGNYGRPGWKPYIYRDPGASRQRAALAAAILAATGPEVDAWDLPWTPKRTALQAYLLKACGTEAAYQRHLRSNERPCPECSAANARAAARRKQERRQRQALRRAS